MIGNHDRPLRRKEKLELCQVEILCASCFSTINKLDVSTKMYSGGPVLERDENERKQILKSKI